MSNHSGCDHQGAQGLEARKEADGIPSLSYVVLKLYFLFVLSHFCSDDFQAGLSVLFAPSWEDSFVLNHTSNVLIFHWFEHDADNTKATGLISVQAILVRVGLDGILVGRFQLRIICNTDSTYRPENCNQHHSEAGILD